MVGRSLATSVSCNSCMTACIRVSHWQKALQLMRHCFMAFVVSQELGVERHHVASHQVKVIPAGTRGRNSEKLIARCLGCFIQHDAVTYKQAASAVAASSWRRALRQLQEGADQEHLSWTRKTARDFKAVVPVKLTCSQQSHTLSNILRLEHFTQVFASQKRLAM